MYAIFLQVILDANSTFSDYLKSQIARCRKGRLERKVLVSCKEKPELKGKKNPNQPTNNINLKNYSYTIGYKLPKVPYLISSIIPSRFSMYEEKKENSLWARGEYKLIISPYKSLVPRSSHRAAYWYLESCPKDMKILPLSSLS